MTAFPPIADISGPKENDPLRGTRQFVRREQAGKCPESASGRHFWLDVTSERNDPSKRYRCRNCSREVIDEPSSFLPPKTGSI